jgi:hypothetical protein
MRVETPVLDPHKEIVVQENGELGVITMIAQGEGRRAILEQWMPSYDNAALVPKVQGTVSKWRDLGTLSFD